MDDHHTVAATDQMPPARAAVEDQRDAAATGLTTSRARVGGLLHSLALLALLCLTACGGSRSTDAEPASAALPPADVGYMETVAPGATPVAYQPSAPVTIQDVQGTAAAPVVISGLAIHSEDGSCIRVENAQHVVIRDNYLHGCTAPNAAADFFSGYDGYGILVGKATGVTIHNNVVEDCAMGIAVYSATDVTVTHNTVRQTRGARSLRLERVDGAEVAANLLSDNGTPETFWAPGHRDIGIHIVRSDHVDVHDNTVLRSTSDGIAVSGQIDGGGLTTPETDWTGTARDIRIHNNLLLDNMELGIWLTRVHDLVIHHNTIRTGCFTHGAGIGLSFDVNAAEIYANQVVTCLGGAPVGLGASHDNHIYDNVHYAADREANAAIEPHDDPESMGTKAQWSGIPYSPSSGNRIHDNLFFLLGGNLGRALTTKLERAHREGTYEEKGWFACEISEGVTDPACVTAQQALGDQGVPAAYLLYEPLMPDPGPYVVQDE